MTNQAKSPDRPHPHLMRERTVAEQLMLIEAKWPLLYDCIDTDRISDETNLLISSIAERAFDFDSITKGGRGELYRRAQQNPLVRLVGIRKLFELIAGEGDLKNLSPDHKILDVLGGDGVLARAVKHFAPRDCAPLVLTSDLSEGMVYAAQQYGLIAIRQAAEQLLLKDNSMDGVIIAYGTHHLPESRRLQACKEAFRVLRPGGRIVFHDFEQDSPMSDWFRDVVDKYSFTGHSFPHFTSGEIKMLLFDAGFININVTYVYDPFILTADTEQQARDELSAYLLDMYGLSKLVDREGYEAASKTIYSLVCKYFKYHYRQLGLSNNFGASEVRVWESNGRWHIEAPRLALVGSGMKSLT